MKKKTEIELTTNNQPGNAKFRKKPKPLEVNYLYWKIYQKGSM